MVIKMKAEKPEVDLWLTDYDNMYMILEDINGFNYALILGCLLGDIKEKDKEVIQLVAAFEIMLLTERQVDFQLITENFLRFNEECRSGHKIEKTLFSMAEEEMERQQEINTIYESGEP